MPQNTGVAVLPGHSNAFFSIFESIIIPQGPIMKYLQRSVLVCLLLAVCSIGFAQNTQKYQGLLWEITGKNLPKPSYLFGTMHVSNKLAFHLSDSFYHCIRNADVVSLETNPQ